MTGTFEPFNNPTDGAESSTPPSLPAPSTLGPVFSVPFATPLRAVSGLYVLGEGTLRIQNDHGVCTGCGGLRAVVCTDFKTGTPSFYAHVIGQYDRAVDRVRLWLKGVKKHA